MYAKAYTGKYVAQKRRRRNKRLCIFLYVLNLLLLVFAAFRVFSGPEAAVSSGGIVTEVHAATEASVQPTTVPKETFHVDTTPPVISGVADITVYAGDTVSYRGGITVTDDQDDQPELTVDSSTVDLSTPGDYQVVYSAADASGNLASVTAAVTVLEKEADYVDLETIYAEADEVLDSIFWEGITVREQVGAIYSWARSHLTYGGHSDRTDWRQTAYTMLQTRKGDCFGYFALTKLMFERLGIPNIDVEKVKNNEQDSNHYWSLVSIDGGETYYHFDATPRAGQTIDFCLVTDAILDEYSEENKNSHNRDKSLYPETPEELP